MESLSFFTLKGKEAKIDGSATENIVPGTGSISVTPVQIDLIIQLLVNHQSNQWKAADHLDTALSSPPKEVHLKGYIEFLGMRNKEDTLNKLIANGFNSHRVFKSPGLLRSEVRELCLTLSIITFWFNNVGK
ncbi:hypothetical protein VP01_1566g10 [Puccinia sorghi]|uniref:Uncharacterized protein n=1 Tax=Puccinia sorghi TaxID=27349 RepID=A0A0L6VHZ0_9BASI|nr:hypothetical protein VP01_1566g10 [Puccinia sorghi]